MGSIMSLAAGLAIGYFVYQTIVSNKGGNRGKITGRLHKSVKDRKIAGVCGGIAEYLKVDPTIVRLVFALMFFGWGSGLLAYLACAFILPTGLSSERKPEHILTRNSIKAGTTTLRCPCFYVPAYFCSRRAAHSSSRKPVRTN